MRHLRPDPIPLEAQARILDAAIRAPHIGEQWRFILVDDPKIKARLAVLYERSWERLFESMGAKLEAMLTMEGPIGQAARSGTHLARHFAEVPLLLLGFAKSHDGSGIYPAMWSAMLAARAEGIGSTLTGVLQSFAARRGNRIARRAARRGLVPPRGSAHGLPDRPVGRCSALTGRRGGGAERLGWETRVHRSRSALAGRARNRPGKSVASLLRRRSLDPSRTGHVLRSPMGGTRQTRPMF